MGLYTSINRKDFDNHIAIYGRMMGFKLIPWLMCIPMGAPILYGLLDILEIHVDAWYFFGVIALLTAIVYSPLVSYCCRYKLEIENNQVVFQIKYLGFTTTNIAVPLRYFAIEEPAFNKVLATYNRSDPKERDPYLVFALDSAGVGNNIEIYYQKKEISLSINSKFEQELWEIICSVFAEVYKLDYKPTL